MNSNLEELSIRARIAYALISLDQLYAELGLSREAPEYKYFTNIYWNFIGPDGHTIDILSLYMDFSYKYVITFPIKVDESDQWRTTVSEERELQLLRDLKEKMGKNYVDVPAIKDKQATFEKYYFSLPYEVCEAMDSLGEILEFGYDAGGEWPNNSSNSLNSVKVIIAILEAHNIRPPDTSIVSNSKFSDRHGMGTPILKKEIESKLGLTL